MLFDIIAPVYKLFFNYQVRMYERDLAIVREHFSFEGIETALGVGSGTGALCHVLQKQGLAVTGSEVSAGMRKAAGQKLKGSGIEVVAGDVLKGLPFDDGSFQIAISSFVAHGLQKEDRLKMYKEMKRLASEKVIIIDYNNENRSLLTNIVEFLERGDYFNFIKVAREEMAEVFPKVTAIPTGIRSSWYICDAR